MTEETLTKEAQTIIQLASDMVALTNALHRFNQYYSIRVGNLEFEIKNLKKRLK